MLYASPQLLAARAVNQYRRREVFTYMGLRLYLANRCATRDRWSEEVARHLVLSRCEPCYFHALHFKEHSKDRGVVHRDMHLPGPNEAMAEAALLRECARYPRVFNPLDCVYSYRLARGEYREGMYEAYMAGFRERHTAVAAMCVQDPSRVVLYTDIKRYYPNIRTAFARQAWEQACRTAGLDEQFCKLGNALLDHHAAVRDANSHGLLTGPMFSHLIGNLLLREIDADMTTRMQGRYFRYVDDMVLVGDQSQVAEGRERLVDHLDRLGLTLHEQGKDFQITAEEWLSGTTDATDDSDSFAWKIFIGGVKQFLVTQQPQRHILQQAFADAELRVTLPFYQAISWERTSLERFASLVSRLRRRWEVRNLTVDILLARGEEARRECTESLAKNLERIETLRGYRRKRVVPKLRLQAGRLLYIGRKEDVARSCSQLVEIPETNLIGQVLKAVTQRDVSALLGLGTNAVQSAAQVLRLGVETVRCRPATWGQAERQGLAVLALNGVQLDFGGDADVPNDELNRLAKWVESAASLMRSSNPFIREMACLHGVSNRCRYDDLLDSAFDTDEQLAFDALEQLNGSSSGIGC
jgi:hypothetical protein